MLAEQMRATTNRKTTLDLRSNCPVCGHPYQPGEAVLALASLSFAISAVPSSSLADGGDPSSKTILGHHECVLSRLLTLLASFRPEVRFVKASEDFSASESEFQECQHDES
jgi:hypothetical protein